MATMLFISMQQVHIFPHWVYMASLCRYDYRLSIDEEIKACMHDCAARYVTLL